MLVQYKKRGGIRVAGIDIGSYNVFMGSSCFKKSIET